MTTQNSFEALKLDFVNGKSTLYIEEQLNEYFKHSIFMKPNGKSFFVFFCVLENYLITKL